MLTPPTTIHTMANPSPKYRFNVMIKPHRLALLREIEQITGETPSEPIRRAIDAYLQTQTVLKRAEVTKILKTSE